MFKTIIVVEEPDSVPDLGTETLSLETYLQQYPKQREGKIRVVNLCASSEYLSAGYYCSLLAEARKHIVYPSVKMLADLNDSKTQALYLPFGNDISLSGEYVVVFGRCDALPEAIAQQLFARMRFPVMKWAIQHREGVLKCNLITTHVSRLSSDEQTFVWHNIAQLAQHTHWSRTPKVKQYRWKLAILHDPDEAQPPSNKAALKRFVRAGQLQGVEVELVTANSLHDLEAYDGLFIRETTAINHHTYRLAAAAESLGLVVIDDTQSILRCCNKVFLHDAFSYQDVPTLPTRILSKVEADPVASLEAQFDYPMVLKLPESAFSKGVYKVEDRLSLRRRLEELFVTSALIIVQAYFKTDFDWRIGVLNGRAIYACQYRMARGHWQIYNHQSQRFSEGGFSAMATFEVPKRILNAAIKAANVVGKGLYGVDIKEDAGKAYVLEVNDNPSIEHGVEDAYLGNELYMLIMSEFLRRFEERGKR